MPSVADFVKTNAKSLAELVRRRLPPLHDPEADGINPRIHRLLRGPKGPQGHIVTAAVKALGRQDDVVFAMAMGTGKTYSALATAHCHAEGRPYAVIVVCPPHLVKKWEREIRLTIPNPVVIHVPEWNQWLLLSKASRSMIQAPTFFIVPISRAKLGAKWVPAMLTSKRSGELTCPQCGSPILTEDGTGASVAWLKKHKRFCPCGSALWQVVGFHKEMASKIVKRRMRKWFDYLIYDEAHQAKSGETKAGDSLGHFINASRKQLILTGTIIAGKSEDLRHTFYRLNPRRFLDRGIGWNDKMSFARQYGRIESTVRYEKGKKGERARDKKQKVMAGIMPALYRDFVADRTIFLALKDMGIDMPKLIETPTAVDMSPAMSKEYARMKVALITKFMQLINENRTVALKLLAAVAETLLSWPDDPVQKTVSYEDEFGKWHEIYTAPDMSREILPKERKLIEILKQEKAEGRQVWIYITRTATAERLLNILHTSGFATAYLTTRIDPEDREDWIAEFGPGVDCCISHVKLVETGVDLFSPGDNSRQPYNFATLIHYVLVAGAALLGQLTWCNISGNILS